MTIRYRARLSGDVVAVKVLIPHPMETGLRLDLNNKIVPAHHINEIVCKWNDEEVFRCNTGRMVSQNPYFSFKIKGPQKGDDLYIFTTDNKGEADNTKITI
jgi:sulfur-oxidizing protein SoxZ